ncbi:MAG: N-acetyltransferase [Bacteroidota bacterium]
MKTSTIELRQEASEDHSAVFHVLKAAFRTESNPDPEEPDLVDRLRKSHAFIPELSIVAEHQGKIVGHILLTKIKVIDGTKESDSLALAPVSVLPAFQGQGIGGRLIEHAHEMAKAMGHQSIILLGHADYYPRFGYRQTTEFGIKMPFEVPAENCLAIELVKDGLMGVRGRVQYPSEFGI